MPDRLDRRMFAAGALGGAATAVLLGRSPASAAAGDAVQASPKLKALEDRFGGRLGVAALDTGSGGTIAYRADERFPMCSTHKVVVGAAILSLVEQGKLTLDQRVAYGPKDLLEYAPVTRKNVAAGAMTVEGLCQAAVRLSDNTADNLLLKLMGGPAAWTRYARGLGDTISRLDRFETELNTSIPGDPRDTSTPRAMNGLLAKLLLGHALSDGSRARLKTWMLDPDITAHLLRAGVPDGWHVADKSGSGSNGSRNDVGILYPPHSAPIVTSAFYTGSTLPMAARENVLAQCARIVAGALRPPV